MINNEDRFCIMGAGGFGKEVLCCIIDAMVAANVKVENNVCFMVSDEHYKESKILGKDVIRQSSFDPASYYVVVAVGDPGLRKKAVESLPVETKYTTIIHPSAVISKWVTIGEGTIITAGTILTCDIQIGKHAQLNLHTTIGHDCEIGDYFTTAPGVNVSGNCHFGNEVYFGTNSSIKQGIKVCDNVIIGMGGVVVKDIIEPGVYIGNPLSKLAKKM